MDSSTEQKHQSLGELCDHLPTMTRQGGMNHLGVLEEAGLITTDRRGRSKYHYLNPVPIRLIHDRWISRFAERRVGRLTAIKQAVCRYGQAGKQQVSEMVKALLRIDKKLPSHASDALAVCICHTHCFQTSQATKASLSRAAGRQEPNV